MVAQWLRLHLPMQAVNVRSLVEELRSFMPCSQKPKTCNRSNIVANPIKTLKMVHIKNERVLFPDQRQNPRMCSVKHSHNEIVCTTAIPAGAGV